MKGDLCQCLRIEKMGLGYLDEFLGGEGGRREDFLHHNKRFHLLLEHSGFQYL